MLSRFDHAAVFVIAMVLVVTAGQKLLGYAAGKAKQRTLQNFFIPGSAA